MHRYFDLPTLDKEEWNEIVYNIYMEEEGKTGDLIKYYNAVFIRNLKGFLYNLKGGEHYNEDSQQHVIKKPLIPILNVSSPLRESLPYRFNQIMRSPIIRPGLTPFSSLLHAESPSRALDITNSINGRKLNLDDNEGTEPPLSKKLKINSIFEKILGTPQENDSLIRRRKHF